MIIGAKSGAHSALSSVIGSKGSNSHHVIGSKGGAPHHSGRATYTAANRGLGDLGGNKNAPGNTRHPVANGTRDAPDRGDVKSTADLKRRGGSTTESRKKNKAD